MLAKTHRLAKASDIRQTFAMGRSFFTPYFLFKFAKRADGQHRFTVIVSTRFSKKAVTRNKVKRIVREAIRLNLKRFLPGDYVVTAKPALAKQDPESIREIFLKAMSDKKLLQ